MALIDCFRGAKVRGIGSLKRISPTSPVEPASTAKSIHGRRIVMWVRGFRRVQGQESTVVPVLAYGLAALLLDPRRKGVPGGIAETQQVSRVPEEGRAEE